ncbi:MAG: metal ABC transporter permease [Deferribacteraceae bacterium]|jgi:manganese/zinc/iron transport system permease protein|nr:metal ABC transporter permease [Deferribacteraceae bacterium]
MINPRAEIIIIILLTAIACIIPGIFLIKKRLAVYSCGIISSTLLGITAAYGLFKSLDLPPAILLAAAISAGIVICMDKLEKRAIPRIHLNGVIPPFIFSVALVFISFSPDLELNMDMDTILLGELVFLPLDRLTFFGFDLGPLAIYQLLGVIALNISILVFFGKEIVFSMFDANYSLMIDHSEVRSRFALLLATVITAIVAFRVTGIIMIAGLIIAPAFIAALFTNRLWLIIILAGFIGIISNLAGYAAAHTLEITISAAMITTLGIIFLITLIIAPARGLLTKQRLKKQGEIDKVIALTAAHLLRFESDGRGELPSKLTWGKDFVNTALNKGEDYFTAGEQGYILTERGRALAHAVIAGCKLPDKLP